MIIPNAANKKALCIVDVQPLTWTGDIPSKVTKDIVRFIKQSSYDAYVLVEYHSPETSMFSKQGGYTISEAEAGRSCTTVMEALNEIKESIFDIKKTTHSCFKGEHSSRLIEFLRHKQIEEIHFVGFDVNDCVLASAFDAVDLGYYSFILEELCHENSGTQKLRDAALTVLHHQNMTNNSLHPKIGYQNLDLSTEITQ